MCNNVHKGIFFIVQIIKLIILYLKLLIDSLTLAAKIPENNHSSGN